MMNFYTGKDHGIIDSKFEVIRKYVRMQEHTKTGSRAETFRWMVNRMFDLVQQKLKEEKK